MKATMTTQADQQTHSIGIRAKLRQAGFLLLLLLKFKAGRLPITLIALALLPSNFWIFMAYSGEPSNIDFSPKTTREVKQENTAASFSATRQILVDNSRSSKVVANLMKIMNDRGASPHHNWLLECNGIKECRTEFSQRLFSESTSKLFGHLMYNVSRYSLECLNLPDTYLTCSFLYQLIVQSLSNESASLDSVLKDAQFVQYYDMSSSPMLMFINEVNKSLSDSVCRRAILNGKIISALWMTALFHTMLATCGCILHFLATTVSFISGLKENGFLQLMFANGLSVSVYWSIMILVSAVEALVLASIFSLCYHLQCPDFYTKGPVLNLLLVMFLYCFAQALFTLLATVILPSFFLIVVALAADTILAVTMSAVAALRLSTNNSQKDTLLNIMLIFAPGNIAQYVIYVLQPERLRPWSENDKNYMENVLLAMIIFPFITIAIIIYLDSTITTGNGFKLPFAFPFSCKYWFPRDVEIVEMRNSQATEEQKIEPVVNGQPAILIKDISVKYNHSICNTCHRDGHSTLALNSVSCTIYENQITALIGHNGAGKTTLIRMLTGEEAPTSGQAVIKGRTVTDPYQRLTLQRWVSICKQVNVLSQYLTVAESIKLAVLSKGLTMESQQQRIDYMLKQLGLSDKKDTMAMDMSGGQLRKVCCIIAMLGDPAVVMLDEPTSGLDPVSRRRLWQILQDFKPGRCILLCTQFMDEADILADRKLFLSSGKLICAGSSLFLKHLFGCSTTINVSLKPEKDAGSILEKLHQDVQLISQKNTEIQLRVAPSSATTELRVLGDTMQILESQIDIIDSFGVSEAVLDDIFLRLADKDAEAMVFALSTGRRLSNLLSTSEDQVLVSRHPSLVSEEGLGTTGDLHPSILRTFAALMVLNMRRQVRAPLRFLCRFLMPIVLIAALAGVTLIQSKKYASSKRSAQKLAEYSGYMSYEDLKNMESTEVVRAPVLPFKESNGGICVSDYEDNSAINELGCQVIAGSKNVFSLRKPRSVGLGNFLLENSSSIPQIEQIQKSCSFGCSIVYSTSYNKSHPNRNRSIVVGQYGKYYPKSQLHNPSYDVFKAILNHSDIDGHFQVRLSTIVPFQDFRFESHELLVLLMFYSIIPITFMIDPVEDKASRVRQQMYVMGLSGKAYWANTFFIHWIQHILYVFLAMLVCLLWDRYRSLLLFNAVSLPLLFLGTVSNLLTVYCIGSVQQTVNYSTMSTYFFFVLIVNALPLVLMKSRLAYVLCIWLIPPLTPVLLTTGTMRFFIYGLLYFECDKIDDVPQMMNAYLNSSDTRHALAAMPVHIVLQIVFLVVSENWDNLPGPLVALATLLGLRDRPSQEEPNDATALRVVESGVSNEKERVEQSPRSDTNLLEIRRLEKVHPNGVKAVRGVSFGARQGEIFGLLGQNGAGKTTLMSVVVGEFAATAGEAEVRHDGAWIGSLIGTRRGAIGYCPQHDPLFALITVEEHLRFYAQIRGLIPALIQIQIDGLIDGLGLGPHRAKASKHLSGGNKRRLCLAIALLGSPSVIVVDEASTGVDPENKRGIWSAIRGMTADSKRTVVVTTHSMEEVEALCDRVCIMNRGVMIGFGTVQQLRSRHGKAYILQALFSTKLGDTDSLVHRKLKLKEAIFEKFPNCRVLDDVCSSIQFQLPIESIPKLSDAYAWLAENQNSFDVQYFSLHQMSLDQTFVNMMRQHELDIVQTNSFESKS